MQYHVPLPYAFLVSFGLTIAWTGRTHSQSLVCPRVSIGIPPRYIFFVPELTPHTSLGGMLFVTTDPAPTMASSPMVAPGRTMTPTPKNTLFPTITLPIFVKPRCFYVDASCARIWTLDVNVQSSPMRIKKQCIGSIKTLGAQLKFLPTIKPFFIAFLIFVPFPLIRLRNRINSIWKSLLLFPNARMYTRK